MGSSITSAMNANVQGLRGASRKFSAQAQNLASAGAIAGKSREVFLSDINTSSGVQNFSASGVYSTMQQYFTEQGGRKDSEVETHMAITGEGFFVCNSSSNDGVPGKFGFTRVGSFSEDQNGDFVNHAGQFLKVFYTQPDGTPISTDTSTLDGLKTASARGLNGNPVATGKVTLPITLPATDPVTTSYSTPVSIYDSLGQKQVLQYNWTKSQASPQEWTLKVTTDDAGATVDANYITSGTGVTLQFDTQGLLSAVNGVTTAGTKPPPLSITWSTPAAVSTIDVDIGNIGLPSAIRSVGDNYDPGLINVDGRPAGKYISTTIDSQGQMFAVYDNNFREQYAIIPLAKFSNANQLLEATGGVMYETNDSGDYSLHMPSQGGVGKVNPGSLEDSTVDSAEVFTEILGTQQYYNGNLYAITKGQEMLEKLDRALGR